MDQKKNSGPARDVGDYRSGQETVLFKESTQAFCRLNETASIIWRLLKLDHDEKRIAARLVQDYAVTEHLAGSYVRSIISDLNANGFLADPAAALPEGVGEAAAGSQARPWDEPGPRLKWHTIFAVQNVRVEVSADDNRCIDLLEQTFGFLLAQREFEQKGAAISVWIHSAAQQRYSVHYGSTTVHDCRLDQVPPVVHAAIFLAYYDNNFRFLAFHSAAVCAGRQLIILPGKSGSGKSSLTAALVSSGFSYVTDELLLVDLHAETLKGAPLAIGLKPGSWDLIKASCPAIEAMPAFERQDGKTIKYLRPPTLCRDYTLDSIGAIVFPSLREGDEASLHPLSAAETFFRLTDAGYDTHRRMSRKDVSLIFDWIGAIPAYELRYRGMDKAVQAISRLPLA